MKISDVNPQDVDQVWDLVRGSVQKVLDRDYLFMDLSDVKETLESGLWKLWLVYDGPNIYGVGVTELLQFPKAKICQLTFISGREFEKWQDMIEQIAVYATEKGCSRLRMVGRPGFKKVLSEHGFEASQMLFSRKLP